jgi:hypothetical protein
MNEPINKLAAPILTKFPMSFLDSGYVILELTKTQSNKTVNSVAAVAMLVPT